MLELDSGVFGRFQSSFKQSQFIYFLRYSQSIAHFNFPLKIPGLKPQLTARLTKALKIEETSALAECIAEDSNQADNSKGSAHSIDCGSNDCMDIDMADIVIIDEYDSTKNETRQEELEKKVLPNSIFT